MQQRSSISMRIFLRRDYNDMQKFFGGSGRKRENVTCNKSEVE